MDLEANFIALRKAKQLQTLINNLLDRLTILERNHQEALIDVHEEISKLRKEVSSNDYVKNIREWLGILDERYGNKYGHIHWVAKDIDGVWWGFDSEPVKRPYGWNGPCSRWEYGGDRPDNLGTVVNDTINWEDSLIRV